MESRGPAASAEGDERGRNAAPGDGLRHWVHWEHTDNPNSLWNPCIGGRRQAEWDDHGEAVPMWHDGPDVWVWIAVPEGVHRVSMYFFNKDGHDGPNRWRDYTLDVYRWPASVQVLDKEYPSEQVKREEPRMFRWCLSNVGFADLLRQTPAARSRVHAFWGGQYQSFAVNGPGQWMIKVGRNYSFNTIVSCVFIDRMQEEVKKPGAFPYEMAMPWMGNLYYNPPAIKSQTLGEWPKGLWELSETVKASRSTCDGLAAERHRMIALYRLAQTIEMPGDVLANWRWRMPLWIDQDRKEFAEMMAASWAAMKKMSPQLCENN